MKELISLHVGQTGVRIGDSCWELLCTEHGVKPDGQPIINNDSDLSKETDSDVLFSEARTGKFTPRAVYADIEAEAIDKIRKTASKSLYHPDQLISGKESTGGLFSRGYNTLDREMDELVVNQVRKLVENCENLQSFVIFHSAGGGTGSGYSSLLLEELSTEYGRKKSNVQLSVYPSDYVSNIVVEPYNAVLHMSTALEQSDCTFVFDNRALSRICSEHMGITTTNFDDLNNRVSQVMSYITTSSTSLRLDFSDLLTNLIPYPMAHFPLVSMAPLISSTTAPFEPFSVLSMTQSCFLPSYQMLQCDVRLGTCLSCAMLYRGKVQLYDVNAAVENIKSRKLANFTEWCPTGVKVAIHSKPPPAKFKEPTLERSLCLLSNNTAIVRMWKRLRRQVNLMYRKRAYLHWYLQDCADLDMFTTAQESLTDLITMYDELLIQT